MTQQHADTSSTGHVPVMLTEVLQTLAPASGEVYIDGTFGAGGYTRAILEKADCSVYAIDRDPHAYQRALNMEKSFSGRMHPLKGCFGDMQALIATQGIERVDGIVLDLGVSSIQLSDAIRGFSFQHDGPLDMRMGDEGISAYDVVNSFDEAEIADIIYTYGEEKASRRIARAIVSARQQQPIETTKQLVSVIHSVIPRHGGMKIDPATRSFQGIRIFVNDEMGEIDRALAAAEKILKPGGRLVVVSFHSLEDARVKKFFREKSGKAESVSRHMPFMPSAVPIIFELLQSSGIAPTDAETSVNPRARSARLRWGVRTAEGVNA